jgi:hypothetical protein
MDEPTGFVRRAKMVTLNAKPEPLRIDVNKTAVNNAGPPVTQEATFWDVEALFGWLATTADLVKAFSGK